ncbi:MAG: hypothetical protein L6V88_11355 [Anaerotruncus sp.]|nr:MAG: hypothetical protein L6V88_11355 [Anaerotruncus sp.]
MSGIVVYSEYEAKRNEFAVSKFKKYLGAELVTAENLQISAKHDFVINRTNNAKIARCFENLGVRVFNPSPLTALANDKQACYEFMQSRGIEIMPVNQTAAPVVEKPANGKGGQGVRLIKSGEFKIKPGFVYQKAGIRFGQGFARVAHRRRNNLRRAQAKRFGFQIQFLPRRQGFAV